MIRGGRARRAASGVVMSGRRARCRLRDEERHPNPNFLTLLAISTTRPSSPPKFAANENPVGDARQFVARLWHVRRDSTDSAIYVDRMKSVS